MPYLVLNTNVPKEKIPEDFHSDLADLVECLVKKPAAVVQIQINAGQDMTFGKTREPCAWCTLEVLNRIDLESNKIYAKALTDQLHQDLGIPIERMFLVFVDRGENNVSFNYQVGGWGDKDYTKDGSLNPSNKF